MMDIGNSTSSLGVHSVRWVGLQHGMFLLRGTLSMFFSGSCVDFLSFFLFFICDAYGEFCCCFFVYLLVHAFCFQSHKDIRECLLGGIICTLHHIPCGVIVARRFGTLLLLCACCTYDINSLCLLTLTVFCCCFLDFFRSNTLMILTEYSATLGYYCLTSL